jgi:hypothetical protein
MAHEFLPDYTDVINANSPFRGININSVRPYNGDFYSAGSVDEYPVMWKHHVMSRFNYTPSIMSQNAWVNDIFVTPSGVVCAVGRYQSRMSPWDEEVVWIDNERFNAPSNMLEGWWNRPRYIYVRETAAE